MSHHAAVPLGLMGKFHGWIVEDQLKELPVLADALQQVEMITNLGIQELLGIPATQETEAQVGHGNAETNDRDHWKH